MTRAKITQKNTQKRTHREQGQALILIALGLFVLIAAVGLATDAALLYKTKQDLQRTVDSAALAAAYKLPSHPNAENAANEFARLHGYDLSAYPLVIGYPVYVPIRKAVSVKGSMDVKFAFLSIIGIRTTTVSAIGEAEAAPMDIYLIFDLSESMTYDTYYTQAHPHLPCSWDYQSDCVAQWCNTARKCDPLDIHVKPAAKFFLDQLDPTYDRVGLVVYDQYGIQITPLSNDFTLVKAKIDSMNAFSNQESTHPSTDCPLTSPATCSKQTNIGDGIMIAHSDIAIEGRKDAIWSMVLMTDGKANVYRNCPGCVPAVPTCPAGKVCWCSSEPCTPAETWAIYNATDSWTKNETVIYTIVYGDTANNPDYQALMIKIADCTDDGNCNTIGGTKNFWAAPDEAHLRSAFVEIADRIYSRLIK